jgi:hypothetical protein
MHEDGCLLESSNHKRKLLSEEMFCLEDLPHEKQKLFCLSRGTFWRQNIYSENNLLFCLDNQSNQLSSYHQSVGDGEIRIFLPIHKCPELK